ncbi:MAG TPA: cyanophycinase [Gemmatimonadaceae bacterium]|nr:cyanophycinase [Gemmatimonadaceae bacterium]
MRSFRVPMRLIVSLTLLVGATSGCTPPPASASRDSRPSVEGTTLTSGARGHLLLVGGGPIPTGVTRLFIDLAGGRGRARIAVIPTASALASTGPDNVATLKGLGADAFVVNITRTEANDDSIVRKLDGATGIWFSGGDQNRITAAMSNTRAERAIRDRYMSGAVIGGTSAGAAVMSERMFTGDERRPGGSRPLTDSTQANVTIDRENVVTAIGFGLLRGAIVDQHFVRRRRHNRLVSVVLEDPTTVGVGIDEATALHVHPDGTWRVVGATAVVVIDARTAAVTPRGSMLGASGIRMHVLPAGSTFDPVSGKVLELGVKR